MEPFTFVTPSPVHCRWGAATDGTLAAEVAKRGRRPLLVCGKSLQAFGTLEKIAATLQAAGVTPALHVGVPPEPTLDDCRRALDAARGCDSVLAVGGGSVLDVAKAAALAPLAVSVDDLFSGRAPVPEDGGLPIVAAPTTAGTGAEATWVGVFTDIGTTRKSSFRGGAMLPCAVVLDARLTLSCPPSVTAASGMDALVQAIESYTSRFANPLTRALAREATVLIGANLETAVRWGDDRPAREAMLLGSYLAGVALNTSRLGLVHGLAHPIGARTGAAHGLLCGLLMPAVMRFNQPVSGERYAELARALGQDEPLEAFVEGLLRSLALPSLRSLGLSAAAIEAMADESLPSGSSKANPRTVTREDALAVLRAATGA